MKLEVQLGIDDLREQLNAAREDAESAEKYAGEVELRLEAAMRVVGIVASAEWEDRLGEAIDLSCEILAELGEE